MNVKVEVNLSSTTSQTDKKEMYEAVEYLANDKDSIVIIVPPTKSNMIIAEFTIKKAKQIDVVNKIRKEFSSCMSNYSELSISFPKKLARTNRKNTQKQFTSKQGQY